MLSSSCDELTPETLFGGLPVLKLRVSVCIEGETRRSPLGYLGSTWRGLLGWELQRLVCPFEKARRSHCDKCIVHEHCPYWLLIEKQAGSNGQTEPPRGYILFPLENGAGLDITLFGCCADFAPAVLTALVNGEKRGLGAERIAYRVTRLTEIRPDGKLAELNSAEKPALAGPFPLRDWLASTETKPAAIRITTPVRLREKGKYQGEAVWPFFFTTLARRLETLDCQFNKGTQLGRERYLALQERFAEATASLHDKLRWQELSRWSNTQRTKVPMGGLVGEVAPASSPEWLTPWWQAAALVHVGKGAVMGLGRVELQESTDKRERS